MVTKFHLFENLNYARSVLRKKGLDDKNEDFLKIREMSKDKSGYLGLLTKLHFVDNVPFEELQSIYTSLVELNINVGDALKMDYIQLSDFLMDKTSVHADNGYKFEFTDGVYDYFRVMTYEGLLNCGSPSWCIKTKSYWDKYTNNNPGKNKQWVVIKKINKKLLTPNTNYLDKYVNTSNPSIRFGLTFNVDSNEIYAFDDNDQKLNIANGVGKRVHDNIKKFMRGEEVGVISYDKILGKEAIITFDRNKKIYLINNRDVKKIEEFVVFGEEFKGIGDVPIYLLTVNGQFNRIIQLSGYYVSEFDGKSNENCPVINQKVYYELAKYRRDRKEYVPSQMMPIAFKMGIWNIDEFLKNNTDCSIIKNKNNKEYLVVPFINKDGKFILNIVKMAVESHDGSPSSNIFIIYKGRRPSDLLTDIGKIVGANFKGFSDLVVLKTGVDKKTRETIENIFGLDNLVESINKYFKKEDDEKAEKRKVEEEKNRIKKAADDERKRLNKIEQERIERERIEREARAEQERLAEVERQRLEQEEYDREHPSLGRKVKNWLGFN